MSACAAPAPCCSTASRSAPASRSRFMPMGARSRPSRVVAEGNRLHPLQEAFLAHGGLQCGICTPGQILAAKALLDTNPSFLLPSTAKALRRLGTCAGMHPARSHVVSILALVRLNCLC